MKKPKLIRIVADKGAAGQSSISHLIGRTFPVISMNWKADRKPDGTLNIDAGANGRIVIQREEYEVVQ